MPLDVCYITPMCATGCLSHYSNVYHIVLYPSTARAQSAKPPSDYLTPIGGGNIKMEENAAYGHVTSSSGQHVPPSGDSETV